MNLHIMLAQIFFILENARTYTTRDVLSRRVHVSDVLSKIPRVGKLATTHQTDLRLHASPLTELGTTPSPSLCKKTTRDKIFIIQYTVYFGVLLFYYYLLFNQILLEVPTVEMIFCYIAFQKGLFDPYNEFHPETPAILSSSKNNVFIISPPENTNNNICSTIYCKSSTKNVDTMRGIPNIDQKNSPRFNPVISFGL